MGSLADRRAIEVSGGEGSAGQKIALGRNQTDKRIVAKDKARFSTAKENLRCLPRDQPPSWS
jgi:hypothetical protein